MIPGLRAAVPPAAAPEPLRRRPWWLAAWWLCILAAVVLVAYGLTVTAAVRGQLEHEPAEPPAIVVTPYPTPSPTWRSPR